MNKGDIVYSKTGSKYEVQEVALNGIICKEVMVNPKNIEHTSLNKDIIILKKEDIVTKEEDIKWDTWKKRNLVKAEERHAQLLKEKEAQVNLIRREIENLKEALGRIKKTSRFISNTPLEEWFNFFTFEFEYYVIEGYNNIEAYNKKEFLEKYGIEKCYNLYSSREGSFYYIASYKDGSGSRAEKVIPFKDKLSLIEYLEKRLRDKSEYTNNDIQFIEQWGLEADKKKVEEFNKKVNERIKRDIEYQEASLKNTKKALAELKKKLV